MELVFEPKEFLRKTVLVIKKPKVFYKEIEKEKGWKDAFVFSIAIALIASVFGLLQLTLLAPVFRAILPEGTMSATPPEFPAIIPAFFMSVVLVVGLGFVWAWVLHQWLRLWKLKGEYTDTYQIFAYSRAPLALLGWLPYIGGLFGLYSLYVLAVGISVHYKVTKRKGFLLLLPLVVGLVLLQAGLFAFVTQAQ